MPKVALCDVQECNEQTKLILKTEYEVADYIKNKHVKKVEIRIDDGRLITNEQRKKIYATVKDISDWSGYTPEDQKEWLKYLYVEKTGDYFPSFSSCSIETARMFLNVILEYAIENGIELTDMAVNRTDDIDAYLCYCIKFKRCCICGKPGEIHHVDTIGMGNNRKELDDSDKRKMCLCRLHHTLAHQRGQKAFDEMYKVYGVLYDGVETPGEKPKETADTLRG